MKKVFIHFLPLLLVLVAIFYFWFDVLALLSRPTLISPSNNSLIPSLTPTLDWSDVNGAGAYEYQVRLGSTGGTIVDRGVVTQSQVTLPAGKVSWDRTYYWQVRACTDNSLKSCSSWSSYWNFKIGIGAPNLISPPNGTTISTPPIILDWSDVLGVKVYQYEVIDPTTTEIVDTATVSKSEATLSFEKLLAGKTYYWKVRACLDESIQQCGSWSPQWSFRLASELPGTIKINTASASKWKPELMNRNATCSNIISNPSRCWQVYESCFDNRGSRIRGCHLTLAASFSSSFNYNIYFTDKKSNTLISDNIFVGTTLKLNLGNLIGEWFFAGGTFDSPPVTFVDDAEGNYNKMAPITSLYQYSINAHHFNSQAFNILRPKLGVAVTNPLKNLKVSTNDKFEISKTGNDYYFKAINEGIGKITITIPQTFAYSTIDNLWFEKGYVPEKQYTFQFLITTPNQPPIANAGADKEVFEDQSVTLEGSGSDPDNDPINFSWSCNGGSLSKPNSATPIYTAPQVEADTIYRCVLTVTDSKGASAFDSVDILVKNVPPNQPPIAGFSCDSSKCGTVGCVAYNRCPFRLVNESTDPDGQSDIKESRWDILNYGTSPDLRCAGICDFSLPLLSPGKYTVSLEVSDSQGAKSDISKEITILQDAKANFLCSNDNTKWESCHEFRVPFAKEKTFFKDASIPSEGAEIIKREWYFEGGSPSQNIGNETNPYTIFQQYGKKTVRLKITDSKGRTNEIVYEINVSLPMPQWRESPPVP